MAYTNHGASGQLVVKHAVKELVADLKNARKDMQMMNVMEMLWRRKNVSLENVQVSNKYSRIMYI